MGQILVLSMGHFGMALMVYSSYVTQYSKYLCTLLMPHYICGSLFLKYCESTIICGVPIFVVFVGKPNMKFGFQWKEDSHRCEIPENHGFKNPQLVFLQ